MNILFQSLTKKIWNASFFLFLALLSISFAYYVTASEEGSENNFFQDTDQDGLSNDEEKAYGTDANNNDTDNDGYSDGVEIEGGYDPLKPAPGDRVVPELAPAVKGEETSVTDDKNYTLKASQVVVDIVNDATAEGAEVKLEDLDSALQEAMGGSTDEFVLPEINVDNIKVKKVSSKLKGDKKKEQERKDALEYITLMGYLLVNNSPMPIQSEDDFQKMTDKISGEAITSMTMGNFAYFDEMEEKGEKFLDQSKDIEVPEAFLEDHIKALQLATYATSLKGELKATQNDPLGQVSVYGKVNALFAEGQGLMDSITEALEEYGIQELPISL